MAPWKATKAAPASAAEVSRSSRSTAAPHDDGASSIIPAITTIPPSNANVVSAWPRNPDRGSVAAGPGSVTSGSSGPGRSTRRVARAATASTPPIAVRCTPRLRSMPAAVAPATPPTTAPMLQSAWKLVLIDRP